MQTSLLLPCSQARHIFQVIFKIRFQWHMHYYLNISYNVFFFLIHEKKTIQINFIVANFRRPEVTMTRFLCLLPVFRFDECALGTLYRKTSFCRCRAQIPKLLHKVCRKASEQNFGNQLTMVNNSKNEDFQPKWQSGNIEG